jgi:creatinine amidohydrolase
MSAPADLPTFWRVQCEMLLPSELRQALAVRAVGYVPLGAIEWHCEHLPVGLDALTAHGICLRAAMKDGGLVLPPLYYATGGEHGGYPWTIMMADGRAIAALLRQTLERMRDFGFALAVLFSGHFALDQVAMIERLADDWNARGGPMKVLGLAVSAIEGLPLAPDHAAIFETTLLGELWPTRVRTDLLPPVIDGPLPETDSWSRERHDARHPLHGIFGPDPRAFDAASAPKLVDAAVDWIVERVAAKLAAGTAA